MKFKTDRIQKEFESNQLPWKLVRIIQMIENFCLAKYNYEITITDILRTQEEQDAIYEYSDKYREKPWKSVHQVWRGVDLRTRDMPSEAINEISDMVNKIQYDPNRPEKKSCIYHNVGAGIHLHLQCM